MITAAHSVLQGSEHNLCDILWDLIPLFKIPNVELVIKHYRENKQVQSMQPKG